MSKYHFTYKTVDPFSGEYYIGKHSTHDLNDGYQGSGHWVKRGVGDQRMLITGILAFFDTEIDALTHEAIMVTEDTLDDPLCKNIALGGGHAMSGRTHTEETKQKISRTLTGRKRPDEFCKRMSKALSGRTLPPEVLAKREATKKRRKARDSRYGTRPLRTIHVEVTCLHCGDVSMVWPSKARRKYCSNVCFNLDRKTWNYP